MIRHSEWDLLKAPNLACRDRNALPPLVRLVLPRFQKGQLVDMWAFLSEMDLYPEGGLRPRMQVGSFMQF